MSQSKACYIQRNSDSFSGKKETADIDIFWTSGNVDRKMTQTIWIMRGSPMKIKEPI